MMCGSRTVTTALERGRESQSEGQREGGTWVVVVVGDESGRERKEECERICDVCVCA